MKFNRAALAVVVLLSLPALPYHLPAQSAERGLDAKVYIDVARDVLPSVVNITIEPRSRNRGDGELDPNRLRQLFQDDGSTISPFMNNVSGSGVVIDRRDQRAYVVTNNHVVTGLRDNQQIRLTFHGRSENSTNWDNTTEIVGDSVRVLGVDQLSDLAILEFDVPEGFDPKPIEFADSDTVEVGENVVALGNPLDLNHTVTRGIVSGKGRDLGQRISIERLLQTDAVIQPGNSGGPLVNLDGKIVGINNAIASRSGYWQGTGFAIPSNDVRRVSFQLIDQGRVSRGYLGVTMRALQTNMGYARSLNLESEGGVIIENIVAQSPADVAGMVVLDVVTKIDGQPIKNPDDMLQVISRKEVDSQVEIEVVRMLEDEKPGSLVLKVKLAERPPETALQEMHRRETVDQNPNIQIIPEIVPDRNFGMQFENYYDRDTKTTGLRVTAIRPDSPAAIAGLRVNDLVTSLNGRDVSSANDFRAAMRNPANEDSHTIRITRDGQSMLLRIDARN